MVQPTNEAFISLKTLENDKSFIDFSSLKKYYCPIKSKGFSIKYVAEGVERYTLNGQQYPIGAGQYLLSNQTNEGCVEIDSPTFVKGICITVSPDIIAETVASICSPNTAFPDLKLGQFLTSNLFLENQYAAEKTQLGQLLAHLGGEMQKNRLNHEDLTIAFFYALSERIVADQMPVFKQLQTIPSLKTTTKKDLFRRLSQGKAYMDACFLTPLTIESIAQEAYMSEYHFFRLFTSTFGISPHQYLLKKRLEYGYSILQQDKYAVSTAACESGFSDIHAFSKAFKKHFGCTPSSLLK